MVIALKDANPSHVLTKIQGVECQRCGHEWVPSGDELPLTCNQCKRYDWWCEEPDMELHKNKGRSLKKV